MAKNRDKGIEITLEVRKLEDQIKEMREKFNDYQRKEPDEREIILSKMLTVPFFYWFMGYEAGQGKGGNR